MSIQKFLPNMESFFNWSMGKGATFLVLGFFCIEDIEPY